MTALNVRRYTWDLHRPTARDGARVTVEGRALFIPAEDLLAVATGLADVLEQITKENR